MATDTAVDTACFEFTSADVQAGDRYHLKHPNGEVVIVITDLSEMSRPDGVRKIIGLATDLNGKWWGTWGDIIFREPIKLGVKTNATFDAQRLLCQRLEVVPTRLKRVRNGRHETLLG